MKNQSANWAAVGIRTLATAKIFRPFVIFLSTGTDVQRLIVPHPSCVGISRKLDKITWEHGAEGKLVFEPRLVLRIETGVESVVAEARERHQRTGKRHQRRRRSRGLPRRSSPAKLRKLASQLPGAGSRKARTLKKQLPDSE